MKSHKIQRLEFISDKIEGRDCKREIMCIRFGHATRKNELVWGSPWEDTHGQSWSSLASRGELDGEEGEVGKGEGEMGRHGEGEGCKRGCHGESACCSVVFWVLYLRKNWLWGRRRGGKREEKEKEGKEKKRKKENLKIFGEANKR
jgi:hypothetical protein